MIEGAIVFCFAAIALCVLVVATVAIRDALDQRDVKREGQVSPIDRCPECLTQICPRCSGCKCSSTPCHCAAISQFDKDVDREGEGDEWKKGGKS